jgi:hypothetical protein
MCNHLNAVSYSASDHCHKSDSPALNTVAVVPKVYPIFRRQDRVPACQRNISGEAAARVYSLVF